ncbi:MAG: hypothetical protein AB8G17_04905 [Gammaproteobacteria bacterium]
MQNTRIPRPEALIVHKYGLTTIAPYMAMPIVPVDKFHTSPTPRRARRSLRARLRAILTRTA